MSKSGATEGLTWVDVDTSTMKGPNGVTVVDTAVNGEFRVHGKFSFDSDSNNTYSIDIQAPTTLSKDSTFTLPEDGSAGHFLKTDGNGVLSFAQASSPEVYGFNASSGNLIVTTTNAGADNISASDYAAFEDTLFAASGFTFSINASGNLIATI